MADQMNQFEGKSKQELEDMARKQGMSGVTNMSKEDLMNELSKGQGQGGQKGGGQNKPGNER